MQMSVGTRVPHTRQYVDSRLQKFKLFPCNGVSPMLLLKPAPSKFIYTYQVSCAGIFIHFLLFKNQNVLLKSIIIYNTQIHAYIMFKMIK